MEPTKQFSTSGKNRLRFVSAKARGKRATADVYRTSDRRQNTSATAERQNRVHSADSGAGKKKRRKNKDIQKDVEEKEDTKVRYFGRDTDAEGLGIGRTAVIVSSRSKLPLDQQKSADGALNDGDGADDQVLSANEEQDKALLTGGTIFLVELEVASLRNGSQLFQNLAMQLRPLSKSLAELLHHKKKIVELLCAFLLSPREDDSSPTPRRRANEDKKTYKKWLSEKAPNGFVANLATSDVLHLFGVLAREIRQEIYPFLNTTVLPRIIDDLLNPPSIITINSETHQNNVLLDVSLVESACRALSYLFKYNSDEFINSQSPNMNKVDEKKAGDADIIRQYYGKTICHKREVVRRLACESYAPLLRKCTDKGLKRHLSRSVKALASSLALAARENNGFHADHSMERARSDAIDGVSSLLFEVARSAAGRLHSKKGILVIRSLMDCLIGISNKGEENGEDFFIEHSRVDVIYEVSSKLLLKLRDHVVRGSQQGSYAAEIAFADVFNEIHRALESVTAILNETSTLLVTHAEKTIVFVAGRMIDLLAEILDFQNGRLAGGHADQITRSLQSLLSECIYPSVGHDMQCQILNYLCSALKANSSHSSFASRLGKFFPSIVKQSLANSKSNTGTALFLAKNLLPYLSQKVASSSLVPALLNSTAISSQSIEESNSSLILLHTVATTVWVKEREVGGDVDDGVFGTLFTWEAAEYCPDLPTKIRSNLLDVCCIDLDTANLASLEQLSRVGYASRCIPFLVHLECSSDGTTDDAGDKEDSNTANKASADALIRVFQWYAKVMKVIQTKTGKGHEKSLYTVQSLLSESLSNSVIECYRRLSSSKVKLLAKKTLVKTKSYANTLLRHQPKSVWVVRGVAALVKALRIVDPRSRLNDQSNDTFELLAPNLAESNHSLRVFTLEILEHYPMRPFITDHANLDLTDDLDEEPNQRPQAEEEGVGQLTDFIADSCLSGSCDVVSMLKHLELTPVTFDNERNLTSQLSRVEVYARTGKLPIVYAEVVAYHMLGLLHVKFAPIWPAAVKVVVSLSLAQEGPAWPCIEAALKRSMMKPPCDDSSNEPTSNTDAIASHHSLCLLLESSRGKNISLFRGQNIERQGQVPRNEVVDELTLFENVWTIMETDPHLTSTKSKIVVPMFFEFMVAQYYVFHDDDQDSREIKFPEMKASHVWNREELGRKTVQRKLESFLKIFAAVKGPQQLFSHKILLQLFVAFMSNPDAKLASLSFSCVLRFNLPYLVPYAEYIRPMLKKEGLREALTKFDLSVNSKTVDLEHRLPLIPIVTRILFGRLSARGNGAKSSKDSPAARRAAILSFFSGVGNMAGELNYFLYMMVRTFIPRDETIWMDGIENQNDRLKTLIGISGGITADGLLSISLKRQEGFLKLLSDVITQVGFGVKEFVGTFVSLLLALCEQSEYSLVKSIKNQEMKNIATNINKNQTNLHEDNSQNGSIRTLSFLRLADIFNKFASTTDFSMYSLRLWKSMHFSIVALPNTVINAENTPSLLRLLESIASHSSMIPLLAQCDEAIIAVFKCVAGTTRMKVMNSVLRFIKNLLTNGDTDSATDRNPVNENDMSMGHALVFKHIHLLIAQFTKRLQSEANIANLDGEAGIGASENDLKQPPLEGLQLNILCRVSELLVPIKNADEENITTMESLCGLLVPLLKFDSNPNQLYLVRTINSLIPSISADAAMTHFHSLSKLLGPNKAKAGISSAEHRQIIASIVKTISDKDTACSSLVRVAKAVVEINSVSTKYINEHDYERMLPILNGLGAESCEENWFGLSRETLGSFTGPRVLLPLLYTCFHLLYDADGVVSRASNKALKSIVTTCFERALVECSEEMSRNSWIKFIETAFIPSLKIGIMTKDAATRRNFVLLFSHVARQFGGYDSVHLYGDLKSLIRDDDQDLDFFLNVTHVQLHRRARAFNRLRKTIASSDEALFSEQSYTNVLLPLAMHPIYEYSSKTEEAYVLEAISAVGEICKHLPWNKYNNTLQSVLNNLGRYPDQERFLIAMMCSIIDAFQFPVVSGECTDGQNKAQGNGVWRSLKKRIIPKVESFLIKEKVDKNGSKVKSLRSSVTLALMKLFQKFPLEMFEDRLPKIITVVCGSLKNKESNERDIAKDTLSKMAVSLDLKYLPLILTELSVSLNEGYKLHVRSAALHSILVALSKVYQHQPVQNDDEVASLPFERCVPAMLDIIHQDVFGKASEIKEVEHAQKRLIKEAMGSKSYDSLEIIARKIYFKPSIISVSVQETLPGLSHASAVHALVTPLLERLREPDVSPSTIRKVKECLQRVTVGLSTNPGANYDELLPFVFATVSPFVCGWWNHSADEDVLDNDDEEEAPIQVSRSTSTNDSTNLKSQKDNKTRPSSVAVATWNPSSLGSAESQRSAFEAKKKYKRTLYKINDGVSAPKLTGSSRHSSLISLTSNTLNMPANACAVNFGLTLLNSCLKRSKIDVTNELQCSLADPFLPLLAHCTRYSSDSQAIVLSLKSLCFLLRMNLPSVSRTAKELGPGILQHLTSSCAASNTAQNEIVQGCFKTLALLISHPKFSLTTEHDDLTNTTGDSTRQFVHNDALPLKADQMQCLLSLLHGAVRESEQQNATFGLVKAIAAKRYMSPEFFDLMDIILKLSVQSQKHAVRLQCSQIFLNYLLEYPMGNKRMENHLHQIVLNIKYEYEEGRLSAIDLLSSLIQKFPVPFLEGQAHLFFLPLVLSLVKDESSKCKEAVASCILSMLTRLSADTVQSLYGYVKRWSQSAGPESIPMQLASAQLFGIFVEARPDYVKRGKNFSDLAGLITRVISQHSSADDGEWELIYHYLVCMEKLNKFVPGSMASNLDVWRSLVNLLAYPHPWIMQVSARIISGHLNAIDYKELARNDCDSFITKVPGCLYDIARNSCRQIDVEDRLYVDATSTIAIKTITSVFKIMKLRPDLCYTEQNNDNENEEMIPKGQAKDPCLWLMTRLSNIAKPRGRRRRESVFKCFASLCTSCSPDSLNQYLQLIIDPLDRAVREASIKIRPGDLQGNDPHTSLPKEVLQILEDTCGDNFFKAYAEVNRNARQKREKRKQDIAAEAIHDPIAAAQRKINKQRKEKERKKRRIDEQRSSRGALKKNRHN